MKKLAGLALLAEASQPVLADQGVEGMSTTTATFLLRGARDMSLRTAGAKGTMSIRVRSAYGAVGGEAV